MPGSLQGSPSSVEIHLNLKDGQGFAPSFFNQLKFCRALRFVSIRGLLFRVSVNYFNILNQITDPLHISKLPNVIDSFS